MIKLALYLLLYMLPALLLGYVILEISPYISRGALSILNVLIICGGYLLYKRKKQNELAAAGFEGALPDWLKSKTVIIFLVGATILSSVIIFNANKTDIYIDNATGGDVKVKILHTGDYTIKADTYQKVKVVKGDLNVAYNGRKKLFKMHETGKWIWNIDSSNSYFRTTVKYGSQTDLYKDGKNNEEEDTPDFNFIKDEFFNAKVDYVFDVPEKISVKKRAFGSKSVTKTVLYRLNDEQFKDDRPAVQAEELPDVEVKPSKKK